MPANKRVSSVYTHFDILTTGDPYSTDIYAGGKRTVTEGCFTNGDGTIDAYYTASAQFAQSSSYYYINVYDLDPQGSQSSSAEIQFDVSYGSYGSYINSANDYETTYEPAQVLYKQYRNILLNSSTDHFTFAGSTTGSDDILIINFKRNRIKEKLDPGNWELHLSGSKTTIKLIDNSEAETSPNTPTVNFGAGDAYYIVSGTGLGTAGAMVDDYDSHPYGIAFNDLGILILNAGYVSSSAGLPLSGSGNLQTVNQGFYKAISGSGYFAARNEEEISSTHYWCRLKNRKYNFSNNPSWQTGSYGEVKWDDMKHNPKVYVTSIGLYDDNNDLLAVAKLNKPVQKAFDKELLFEVRLDY